MLNLIGESLRDLTDWAAGSWRTGAGSLVDLMERVDAATPLVREVGYDVREVRLTVALKPALSLHLVRFRSVKDEAFDRFVERHSDQELLCNLIGLLRRASKLQDQLSLRNRECEELEIELSVPPVIHLIATRYRHAWAKALAARITAMFRFGKSDKNRHVLNSDSES